jgi:hypothetical protein
MIYISDLSESYIKEVDTSERALVIGGAFDFDSYNVKISDVDISQVNANSIFSFNSVGSVNTFQ